ncbi:hypothetical protein BGZ61DRAFT_478658 [Ilyonectria robusta]|uniref:uncharacterized protein n=1 Tax=Ilyonectria robusta TaxID=1079257 RepID=UPI001E8D4CC0|nr:uncharacterized protein BGZ61DRAFT_478658 [Ilyonectria robusta]KAH8688333.1 hypothetical protein BGZ61DRAFT_478658 [Ilyonectria robusta]
MAVSIFMSVSLFHAALRSPLSSFRPCAAAQSQGEGRASHGQYETPSPAIFNPPPDACRHHHHHHPRHLQPVPPTRERSGHPLHGKPRCHGETRELSRGKRLPRLTCPVPHGSHAPESGNMGCSSTHLAKIDREENRLLDLARGSFGREVWSDAKHREPNSSCNRVFKTSAKNPRNGRLNSSY